MPAAPSPLAITAVPMAFTVKAEITKSLKEGEPVLTNDDEFEIGDAYDPTFEITAEGNGDAPAGIAAAVEGLDDVEGVSGGKTMIDQFGSRQNMDKRNSWSMHAMNLLARHKRMHQGQIIMTIRGDGAPIKAPEFGAVIAALVSGCRFSGPDALLDMLFEREGELRENFVFSFDGEALATFEPKFARETISVKEIERRFLSDEWVNANPHHPIAYMRHFYEERNKRVAEIKDRPRYEVVEARNRSGGTSRCFIPENATAEERAAILEDFKKSL